LDKLPADNPATRLLPILRWLPVALIIAALAVASTSESTANLLGLIAGVCWVGEAAVLWWGTEGATAESSSLSSPRRWALYFAAVGIFVVVASAIRLA
jgi:hypothetical protein